jgi:hypothetical protein
LEGHDVLVLHPGSRFLRLGRSSDTIPRHVVHALARRSLSSDIHHDNQSTVDAMSIDLDLDDMDSYIAQRLHTAKLKPVSSAKQQVRDKQAETFLFFRWLLDTLLSEGKLLLFNFGF